MTEREEATRAVEVEYDRLADFYDRRWRKYIDATLRTVEEAVVCEGNEKILDAPCGTGELERRLLLRRRSLRIVGVDVSREMLRQAQAKDLERRTKHSATGSRAGDFRRCERFCSRPLKGAVQWLQADVAALPLADESFDWAICANSFHYFRSPLEALGEFRRVLRPGGRLVLVDWCDDYLTCKLCSLWLRWTDPAFNRTYSLRHCRSLLEQAGFVVDDVQHFRVGWVWGLMRFVCRRPNR